MTTIKDVAKLAGVSICTVSRTLVGKDRISPQTRAKVLAAVEELGYKPNFSARSLKTGTTATLGLIMPDITNPYYPKIAKCIEEYAEQQGYVIILCNANEDLNKEKRLVEILAKRGVDGVLVLPCSGEIEHFNQLERAGIPYVFLNRYFNDGAKCIPTDNFYGAYTITRYVIKKGHRKICAAYLNFENQIYRERYEGTMQALKEHGLSECEKTFLYDIKDLKDAHEHIYQSLRTENRPTVIVAANDLIAVAAYSAVNQCGLRIPEDVSVTGYDDITMASLMVPPLTSFRQSESAIARAGVDYLLTCIAKQEPTQSMRLKGEIIIRQSVQDLNE